MVMVGQTLAPVTKLFAKCNGSLRMTGWAPPYSFLRGRCGGIGGTARAPALGARMFLPPDAVGRTQSDSNRLTLCVLDIHAVECQGPDTNVT